MTLGDYITWATFLAGAYALGVIAWRRYGSLLVSMLSVPAPADYVTIDDDALTSEPVCPRTDGSADGRTESQPPVARPATLDTVRSLREHGYTREEARAFLKVVDRTLGNDVWAAAKPALPADDDAFVTPYAGRVTRKSYYPDDPKLEYQEPTG